MKPPIDRDAVRALSDGVVIVIRGYTCTTAAQVVVPCPSIAVAEVIAREIKALLDHVSVNR